MPILKRLITGNDRFFLVLNGTHLVLFDEYGGKYNETTKILGSNCNP